MVASIESQCSLHEWDLSTALQAITSSGMSGKDRMQYVNNIHAVIDIMHMELYAQGPLVKSRAQALL